MASDRGDHDQSLHGQYAQSAPSAHGGRRGLLPVARCALRPTRGRPSPSRGPCKFQGGDARFKVSTEAQPGCVQSAPRSRAVLDRHSARSAQGAPSAANGRCLAHGDVAVWSSFCNRAVPRRACARALLRFAPRFAAPFAVQPASGTRLCFSVTASWQHRDAASQPNRACLQNTDWPRAPVEAAAGQVAPQSARRGEWTQRTGHQWRLLR